MATFYLKSGSGAAEYNAAQAYSVGDRMVIAASDATTNYATARKWVWECTTGGTTNSAITWPASVTQDVTTVTQNSVVFTARKPGFSSGTTADWSYAGIYGAWVISAAAANDTVYVSNNHAETQSSAVTWTYPQGLNVICVDDTAAPPTALATTATVTTTGATAIEINSNNAPATYTYGLNFVVGSGSSSAANFLVHVAMFDTCSVTLATTSSSAKIQWTLASYWKNVSVKFSAAGQTCACGSSVGTLVWSGGSLLSGGTSPTTLLASLGAIAYVENLDLSNASSSMDLCSSTTFNVSAYFRNIKLPTNWSGALNSSGGSSAPTKQTAIFDLQNVDYSGSNYRISRATPYGNLNSETTITRAGGANNGTSGLSWKVVTSTANATAKYPQATFWTPEIVKWVGATGSTVTATVEIVSSATLNNDDIWLEVTYLSASGAPLGTVVTNAKAGLLANAAAHTTSTATWNSSPATPVYQKLAVSFVPQLKGFIHAQVRVAKASTTVYIDPKITLS